MKLIWTSSSVKTLIEFILLTLITHIQSAILLSLSIEQSFT